MVSYRARSPFGEMIKRPCEGKTVSGRPCAKGGSYRLDASWYCGIHHGAVVKRVREKVEMESCRANGSSPVQGQHYDGWVDTRAGSKYED